MTAVAAIAGREVLAGVRNRWMLAASLLLGVLALTLAFVGSAPGGTVAASPLAITVVSLSSLSVFLVPLIGLLVSYDTLVGEIERGTMPLLMTHPVTRSRIVLGKFAGQVAILAVATVVGFGVAALVTGLGDGGDAEAWGAFGVMVGGSILLGAAFIALGTLFSAVVAERGTAAGVSAAAWLIFVVLFDMALLAILVADEGQVVSGDLFRVLLLLNPTDVYRMLTLSGSETVGALSGMAGVSAEAAFGHAILLAAMVLWIAVPLGLAGLLFGRKEL
ncbi:MAG: ABC transporter permease subunit [Rhodospirillales bacterium]|nr:ABC transporter permease subunit [Rhodospirillales bacterium]MDE0379262.1 ABC transporter permease subunit [Rhodospirillales bacterium]